MVSNLKCHSRRRRLLLLLTIELGWWSYCPASAGEGGGGGACTDSAATNFNSQAATDDGNCSYTEAHLRQQEGKAAATCYIFEGGAWPAALTDSADATRTLVAPADSPWIVQGKPLRGGSSTQPLLQPFAYHFTAGSGADMTLRYIRITDSAGEFGSQEKGAGLWLSGGVGTLTAVAFDKTIESRQGGAIYAGESSTLSVTMGVFEQTSALKGGAISASSSTLTVSRSTFRATRSQTHGGGAIYAEKCPTVTISESRFEDCTAEGEKGGTALFLTDCGQILISDSSFTPFDKIKTVYFDTSWLSSVGGCGEHPCATGHSCTYAQYSRNCEKCPRSTVGRNGIVCTECEAGYGPNVDQTDCDACSTVASPTGPTFSPAPGGRCEVCAAPNIVNSQHTQCTRCPAGKEPNDDHTSCKNCTRANEYSTEGVCQLCESPNVASADHKTCSPCLPGFQPKHNRAVDAPEDGCERCPDRTYSTFGVLCQICQHPLILNAEQTTCRYNQTSCPAGKYKVDSKCEACPLGRYRQYDTIGSEHEECQKCSRPRVTARWNDGTMTLNGSVCEPCPAGHGPNSDQTECVLCDSGKFSPDDSDCSSDCNLAIINNHECKPCLDNQAYNGAPGFATGCITCKAGVPGEKPNNHTYASACVSCTDMMPHARFAFSENGGECKDCWSLCGDECVVEQTGNIYSCHKCEPGFEPNPSNTACVKSCERRCQKCDEQSTDVCFQCKFSEGYYNSTEHLIVPFVTGDFDVFAPEEVSQLRAQYQQDTETDGQCQRYYGVMGTTKDWDPSGRIDTETGQFIVSSGFYAISGDNGASYIFQCPVPGSCPESHLNKTVTATLGCKQGYTGALCQACDTAAGYVHSSGSRIQSRTCIETNCFRVSTWIRLSWLSASVVLAMVSLFVVAALSNHFAGTVHVLRDGNVFATCKVFIGFCQIATLFSAFSPEFENLTGNFETYTHLLNLVSVNVPALLKMDCVFSDFYTKWYLRAIGVPIFFSMLAVVKYMHSIAYGPFRIDFRATFRKREGCLCKARVMRTEITSVFKAVAQYRLRQHMETAMFVSYTPVFNSVLQISTCRQLSERRSVLSIDYSVECGTARYQTAQNIAVVLAVLLVAFPVFSVWKSMHPVRRSQIKSMLTAVISCQHRPALEPWKETLTVALRPDISGDAEVLKLVEHLTETLTASDLSELISEKPGKKFRPRVRCWMSMLKRCGLLKGRKNGWTEIEENSTPAVWNTVHNVVARAMQPWVRLINEQLGADSSSNQARRSGDDSDKEVELQPEPELDAESQPEPRPEPQQEPESQKNVLLPQVIYLVQHTTRVELSRLVRTNNIYRAPTEISDGIKDEDWSQIYTVFTALGAMEQYKESCEIHEAFDFLRKVLILCCAFAGNEVSKPMFAAHY
eukprot:COSAG01_NODE_4947_length_4600_cov_3.017552_2_plen_1400_part_00